MNRIILSVITILTALVLAGWSTIAAWSDTVTISNNKIQTGTADLQVSSVGTSGPWNTSVTTSALLIGGLIPGAPAADGFVLALKNNSVEGLNFTISAKITDIDFGEGSDPDKSKLLIAIYPEGATPETGSNWVTLENWLNNDVSLNSTLSAGLSNSKAYNLAAKLSSNASDDWQGRTVTFTLTVNGQQP